MSSLHLALLPAFFQEFFSGGGQKYIVMLIFLLFSDKTLGGTAKVFQGANYFGREGGGGGELCGKNRMLHRHCSQYDFCVKTFLPMASCLVAGLK